MELCRLNYFCGIFVCFGPNHPPVQNCKVRGVQNIVISTPRTKSQVADQTKLPGVAKFITPNGGANINIYAPEQKFKNLNFQ